MAIGKQCPVAGTQLPAVFAGYLGTRYCEQVSRCRL